MPATRPSPTSFTAGTPIVASEVDGILDDIYTELNAIDGAQITTGTIPIARIPTQLQQTNDTYITGEGSDTNAKDMIKINASDVPELKDGAVATTQSASDNSTKIATTAYTDAQVQTHDVNGTPTTIYTKYLTGTLDADSSTSVAHGVTAGLTKILSVTVACYEDVSAHNVAGDFALGASVASAFQYVWDGTNIVIGNVGANVQGNAYYIKVDYIL